MCKQAALTRSCCRAQESDQQLIQAAKLKHERELAERLLTEGTEGEEGQLLPCAC